MKKSLQGSILSRPCEKQLSDADLKPNVQSHKALTTAQLVPTLPESKFFPSSGRNLHISQNSGQMGHTTSANISTTSSANNSMASPINLSLQRPQADSSLNYSVFSQRAEGSQRIKQWSELAVPTTPAVVLGTFTSKLTSFEQGEILKYPSIFCIGIEAKKVKTNHSQSSNFGFDDENGDYRVALKDHIAYRYEVFEVIGKGSFGQVFRVFDYKHQIFCALKMIRNKSRFHQQAAVEIEVLKLLRHKDEGNSYNIVHIQSSFTFRNHICICFELLSMNLYDFLKSNEFHGLSLNLIKRFTIQILQTLSLLNEAKVIHCDLKPENILLRQPNRSAIKVIDFGSSCFSDRRIYTYIQSRFYRAPEIMLGIPYSAAIDMWSLGCILVELYTGFPLFPGESEAEQILCIMEFLGVPPKEMLMRSTRRKLFFDGENSPKVVVNSKGRQRVPGSRCLEELLRNADGKFINLVKACLEWDPACRIRPNSALQCDWILESVKQEKKEISSKNIEKGSLKKVNSTKSFLSS